MAKQKSLKQPSNKFLEDRIFLNQRLDAGVDVHPSDSELKQFKALAKEIDPVIHWTIYGCQKCVNSLVKYVFENYGKKAKDESKDTIPTDNEGAE
jgi:hypothetical protein